MNLYSILNCFNSMNWAKFISFMVMAIIVVGVAVVRVKVTSSIAFVRQNWEALLFSIWDDGGIAMRIAVSEIDSFREA